MKKYPVILIALIGFLFPCRLFPQMLTPGNNTDVLFPMDFNPEYLKIAGVASIYSQGSVKMENQRIEQKGMNNRFDFDTSGFLIREIFWYKNLIGNSDTTTVNYFYNDKNLLNIRRIKDKKGYTAYYYDYDELGRIIKKIYAAETALANTGDYFKLDRQTIIWLETYSYEKLSEKQVKRIVYNDAGKPFIEGIQYHNENDQKIEDNQSYIFTRINQNYSFVFDNMKKVTAKKFYSNAAGKLTETSIFGYDERSNLIHENQYINEIWKKDIFYFNNERTGLLEAIIKKNPETKFIEMYDLSYELYKSPRP